MRSPKRTLRGKVFTVFRQRSNLKANMNFYLAEYYTYQLTNEKLYALSASGNVYVLTTDVLQQELSVGAPT